MTKAARAAQEPDLTLDDDITEPVTEPDLVLDDDDGPDEDDDLSPPDPEPVRAAVNPMDQMVPVSRLNEVIAQRDAAQRTLEAVRPAAPAPAAPARRGFVDPTATPEVQKWQREAGQLLEQGIREVVAEAAAPAVGTSIRSADMNDDGLMRQKYEDYDELRADIEALRGPYMQAAGMWLPREEFYHAVLGKRTAAARTAQRNGRSRAAVQRQAAPARDRNAPPEQGRRPKVRMTPQDIRAGKYSLAQMEKFLFEQDARIL